MAPSRLAPNATAESEVSRKRCEKMMLASRIGVKASRPKSYRLTIRRLPSSGFLAEVMA